MNEIQVFSNEQFGRVRTIVKDGEPWFVGKDVAEILGYSNPRKAIIDHVDEEDKQDGVTIRDSIGREQNPVVINESGLYSLILSSKLPTARAFKRWVTHDVIPALRKTGSYIMGEEKMTDEELLSYALLAAQKKIEQRNARIADLENKNKVLSGEVLQWSDPAILNALVRKYSRSVFGANGFGYGWKAFFKELYYKHSINLEHRKTLDVNKHPKNVGKPTYTYLTSEEVPLAVQTIVSMCEAKNVDVSDVLNEHMGERSYEQEDVAV